MLRSVSFHPPRFWSGLAGSRGTACVSGGGHIAITHGVIVRVLWRAGAEQEGEEEEGHFSTQPTLSLGSLSPNLILHLLTIFYILLLLQLVNL